MQPEIKNLLDTSLLSEADYKKVIFAKIRTKLQATERRDEKQA